MEPSDILEKALKYANGIGVPRNLGQAAELFEDAAKAGSAEAMLLLAKCYASGDGRTASDKLHVEWLRKAAEAGHSEAMNLLADCMTDPRYGRIGTYKEAMDWYKKAADLGNTEAMRALAMEALSPDGKREKVGDTVTWLRLAVAQGSTDAMVTLAQMSLDKQFGLTGDRVEIGRLLRSAAKYQNPQACSMLTRGDFHIMQIKNGGAASPYAVHQVSDEERAACLNAFKSGYWGHVTVAQWEANDRAATTGGTISCRYPLGRGRVLLILRAQGTPQFYLSLEGEPENPSH